MSDNSLVQDLLEDLNCMPDLEGVPHFSFMELSAIQQGADIHKKDRDGNTLLHLACSKVYGTDFLRILLNLHPNINVRNNALETPLLIFVRTCFFNHSLLHILLEMGADPNLPDIDGNTPLHYLADYISHKLLYFKRFTEILMKYNADVNIRNNTGNTPLHWAVLNQTVGFIRILLDNGASVFLKNNDNLTPMDLAYTKRNERPKVFSEMARFAIILNFCNVPINADVLDEIYSLESMQTFNVQCKEELLTLGKIKIGQSDITLYVILKSSTYAFAKYLRNPEILEWFQGFKSRRYKIFGKRLKQHFKEGLARKEAEEHGYPICRRIFQSLPELCVEKIMTYLTNKDLNNLL